MASWRPAGERGGEWLGDSVFTAQLDAPDLAERMAEFCDALKRRDARGRTISNFGGGWQSKDLVGENEALEEFGGLLHKQLAAFLRGHQGNAPPPAGLDAEHDLCLVAVPDQIWANMNEQGAGNIRHSHGPASASLVASGVFYPNLDSAAVGPVARLRLYPPGVEEVVVTPRQGLLVLFSPDLEHEVESHVGGGARMSFAFNLRVRWLDSPLSRAAARGDMAQVLDFSRRGEDIEAEDAALGLRAIHLAAEAGHRNVVETLISLGGDTAAISPEGLAPLVLAAERGHSDIAELLVGTLGSPAAPTGAPPVVANSMQRDRAILESALAAAAEKGHSSVVGLLAETLGPEIESSPFLAVAAASGQAAVVSQLLGLRAGPDTALMGRTPLREAAGHGHTDVLHRLLAFRADAEARDETGSQAAHEAAAQGHLAVVQLLAAAAGAAGVQTLDSPDNYGARPLHWAALRGHAYVAGCLVEARAVLRAETDDESPLDVARRAGHSDVVQRLSAA